MRRFAKGENKEQLARPLEPTGVGTPDHTNPNCPNRSIHSMRRSCGWRLRRRCRRPPVTGWELCPLVDRVENSQGLFERLGRYTSLRPERMVEPEDKE